MNKTITAVFTQNAIFWGAFTTYEDAAKAVATWVETNSGWKTADFQLRNLPFGELL